MAKFKLPVRTGPRNGTFAFTEEGENQILEAIRGGMSHVEVAARVKASVVTIYAICKRATKRIAPASDQARGVEDLALGDDRAATESLAEEVEA